MGCTGGHSAAKEDLPACELHEKYKLHEGCLGRGGCGVVLIGEELSSGTKYAVKQVARKSTAEWEAPTLDEFKQEVRIVKRLSHPHVVRLHDYFVSSSCMYMVFPIFWGGCVIIGMKAHWDARGDIAINAVRTVWKQMVAGIIHLHAQGIIHRDCKPDNFLMDSPEIDNTRVHIALTDFDTACCTAPGKWLTEVVGTPRYLAPELVSLAGGKLLKYGEKVDVWALGVILNGLIARDYLFLGRVDIQFKSVTIPTRLPLEAHDLFLSTLDRNEGTRITSAAILQHEWLKGELSSRVSDRLPVELLRTDLDDGCNPDVAPLPKILGSSSKSIAPNFKRVTSMETRSAMMEPARSPMQLR